jgi:hypothetical protein
VLIALATVTSTAIGQPKQDPTPLTCDGKPLQHHRHRARVILKHAYESGPTRSELRAYKAHKHCIHDEETRQAIAALRDRLKAELEQRQAIAALTPYDCGSHGSFAVPCTIVSRESGYNPRAKNPDSSAGGYYQVIDSTWAAYGGSDNSCYHVAACAPIDEQHRVAASIWDGGAGASHWSETYP